MSNLWYRPKRNLILRSSGSRARPIRMMTQTFRNRNQACISSAGCGNKTARKDNLLVFRGYIAMPSRIKLLSTKDMLSRRREYA